MISRIKQAIAVYFAAILLLPFAAEARLVEVEFTLDRPKTALEKKLFIDSAILEAQSRMLEIYYERASFSPSWATLPHRAPLTKILRQASYREVTITRLEAIERKQAGKRWHFVYRGMIPDGTPVINDKTLLATFAKLLDDKSRQHMTPYFAMEIALAYPSLGLQDKATSFWRHNFQGYSYAMFEDAPVLAPDTFRLSASGIKADLVPAGIDGAFALLDKAPFHPALCEIALTRLDGTNLPAFSLSLRKACLTLNKTDAGYQARLTKAGKALADMPISPPFDRRNVMAEMTQLQGQDWLSEESWLTQLIITSMGDVPANFPLGELIDTDDARSDTSSSSGGLQLESLTIGEDEGDSPMLEALTVIDLQDEIRQFEQLPTIAAMGALAAGFAEAGYPLISEIFVLQAQ